MRPDNLSMLYESLEPRVDAKRIAMVKNPQRHSPEPVDRLQKSQHANPRNDLVIVIRLLRVHCYFRMIGLSPKGAQSCIV